jgi:hypothetical protein
VGELFGGADAEPFVVGVLDVHGALFQGGLLFLVVP